MLVCNCLTFVCVCVCVCVCVYVCVCTCVCMCVCVCVHVYVAVCRMYHSNQYSVVCDRATHNELDKVVIKYMEKPGEFLMQKWHID